jgi:aspartate aminotransferase-like enzyme
MFGPNYYSNFSYEMSYSHRSEPFKKLYKEVVQLVSEKFNLQDYDVIPIVGSGTVAMEVLIHSSLNVVEVIGNEGKFKSRWQSLVESVNEEKSDKNIQQLYCQLETSRSKVFYKEKCFVDGISSFPYYDVPRGTKAFVTCANKQLGAYPGLSFIFVRKDVWHLFKEEELFTTTNLNLYKKYYLKYQTPTTCPLQIFKQIKDRLLSYDLEEEINKINRNSDMLSDAFKDSLVGCRRCPVLTIKKEAIPLWLAKKYQIYNYNNDSKFYQIFTYSAPQDEYYNFLREIKNGSS